VLEAYEDLTQLRASRSLTIYRGKRRAGGAPVLVKVLAVEPGSSHQSRLAQEWQVLGRLQGVAGVPQPGRHETGPEGELLELDDPGGVSLRSLPLAGRLSLSAFLDLALRIDEVCSAIHEAQVVHGEIMPGNIVFSAGTGSVQIVDFGNASLLSRQSRPIFEPGMYKEWLAYISPEQTGRMNRAIDYRTDLYSLGATLYELLTGKPPFVTTDPLELLYSHIARVPRPAHSVRPDTPVVLSQILHKLLSKNAEDRYQSARGLIADLEECRRRLEATGQISEFPIGAHDFSGKLLIPEKLYGRAHELGDLAAAFGRVAAGSTELVLLTGYPGIGKSALARELHQPVAASGGVFAEGKFDQFSHDIPYAALVSALRQLTRLVMARPKAQVAEWRRDLSAAVGAHATALANLIPELALLIGPSPPLPELGPAQARNRFHLTVCRFIQVLASPARPVVLFLDDVQWVDPASLELLQLVLSDPNVRHLLVICAYRDADVSCSHPSIPMFDQLEQQGTRIVRMSLGGLSEPDVEALLVESLHRAPEAVRQLAELLVRKTAGNPFYVRQFLHALVAEGLLRFDVADRAWHWPASALARWERMSENVVDLLVDRLRQLPPEAHQLIAIAACIGSHFDVSLLAEISGQPADALTAPLVTLVAGGFLIRVAADDASPGGTFAFCHDRVQLAARMLLPDARRCQLHLEVARRFDMGGLSASSAQLFATVEHYVEALQAVEDPDECRRATDLLLRAGHEAIHAAAYEAARRFASLARAAKWHGTLDLDRRFAVACLQHAALYGLGLLREADRIYAELEAMPVEAARLAESVCLQTISLSHRRRFADGVDLGLDFLARLGHGLKADDVEATLAAELSRFYELMWDGALERVMDAAALEDPNLVAALKVMDRMRATALAYSPAIAYALSLRMTNSGLAHGWTEASLTTAYAVFMALVGLRGDYTTPYTLALHVLPLTQRHPESLHAGRQYYLFGMVISHWFRPLEEDVGHERRAYAVLAANGDIEFASFTYAATQAALLDTAPALAGLEQETERALAFAQKHEDRHSYGTYLVYRQLARALRGATSALGSFDDAEFDERKHIEAICKDQQAIFSYLTMRALAAALQGDDDSCRDLAGMARPMLNHVAGFYVSALQNFLHSFGICRRLQVPSVSTAEQEALARQLTQNQEWLRKRAQDAPMNFEHLYELIEAERGFNGVFSAAARAYEKSITLARERSRPWHLALAYECAGRFYRHHGIAVAADAYEALAISTYAAWGASAKVDALTAGASARDRQFVRISTPAIGFSARDLDLETLTRTSLDLTVALRVDDLVLNVVSVLLSAAGADHVSLVDMREDVLEIRARGHTDPEHPDRVETAGQLALDATELPGHVLQMVSHTGEPLLLDDPSHDPDLSQDPYFQHHQPRSMLCFAVERREPCKRLVYLENSLMLGAFSPERVRFLQALATQMSITLDNAEMHQQAQSELAERVRAAEHLAYLRSDFVGAVSHELRTPLTAILGFAEVLQRHWDKLDDVQRKARLARIVAAANRQKRLVEDLLHVTQLDAPERELHFEDLTVARLVARAIETVTQNYPGQCIDAEGPEDLHAWGDPEQTEDIVANLLDNAAKYSVEGSPIRVVWVEEQQRAVVRVRDYGPGIAEEGQGVLFTRFGRVPGSRVRAGRVGTGLGLYLGRRSAEEMAGSLDLESTGETGSVFVLRLPVRAPQIETSGHTRCSSVAPSAPDTPVCQRPADEHVDHVDPEWEAPETAG